MAAKAIYACTAGGFTVVGVAQALGTSKDTLGRWLDEYPELKEAFDQGREQDNATDTGKAIRAKRQTAYRSISHCPARCPWSNSPLSM